MNVSSPRNWHALAIAAAGRGDNRRALDLLRREILLDPMKSGATCDAFSIGARFGFAGSARLAAWAVRMHPTFLAGWRHRLDAMDRSEHPATRRMTLRRVCVLSAGRGSDLRQSGQALMDLGDHASAARVLGWASLLLRQDLATLFALAQARFQIKAHAGALAALNRARDAGLPREQEQFWRARLLMASNRYEEADLILATAERVGGAFAERCRVLKHTARPIDFKAETPNPSANTLW